jgi:uncharacterized DUF497 family protein
LKKHRVSFEEATEVFRDHLQLSLPDDACDDEERWITLGNSQAHRLCLVVHTFTSYHNGQVHIRIISARRATRHEQQQYKE